MLPDTPECSQRDARPSHRRPRGGLSGYARAWLLGSLAASVASISSCGTELSPTRCDEWCRATLRAGCANDLPHECVAACARPTPVDVMSLCSPQWAALLDCYQVAPSSRFSCNSGDRSTPDFDLCAARRQELERCATVLPETVQCFQFCAEIREFLPTTCDVACAGQQTSCSVQFAHLFQCVMRDCEAGSPLSACLLLGDAPVCGAQAAAVLACR